VRMMLSITPPAGQHHAIYGRIHGEAAGRYGAPGEDHAGFLKPYSKGDGREDEAFKASKAVFSARWGKRGSETLFMWIGDNYVIGVDYESPAWDAVDKARKAKAAAKGR
jgi:hypothetical protein